MPLQADLHDQKVLHTLYILGVPDDTNMKLKLWLYVRPSLLLASHMSHASSESHKLPDVSNDQYMGELSYLTTMHILNAFSAPNIPA